MGITNEDCLKLESLGIDPTHITDDGGFLIHHLNGNYWAEWHCRRSLTPSEANHLLNPNITVEEA